MHLPDTDTGASVFTVQFRSIPQYRHFFTVQYCSMDDLLQMLAALQSAADAGLYNLWVYDIRTYTGYLHEVQEVGILIMADTRVLRSRSPNHRNIPAQA